MLALLPLLLAASLTGAPVQDKASHDKAGIVLHDPETGATVKLPEDWSFASGKEGMMALSEDKRAFVLLAGSEKNFEQVRADVRALVLARLDDVVIASSTVEGVNERGALEEVVTAHGTGKSKKDGDDVEFAAVLVRSGDEGILVLGAWKDEASSKRVAQVLAGLHMREAAGEGGLVVTNQVTGASVTIPKDWEVVRSRKGMIARCPHGNAMAILMGWQGGIDQSAKQIRTALLDWVFKDVELGEFAAVEAAYEKGDGAMGKGVMVVANGNAIDRHDGKPVDFTALRVQLKDKDEGAVLFGAWKDEEHAKEVESLLASIHFKKLDAK